MKVYMVYAEKSFSGSPLKRTGQKDPDLFVIPIKLFLSEDRATAFKEAIPKNTVLASRAGQELNFKVFEFDVDESQRKLKVGDIVQHFKRENYLKEKYGDKCDTSFNGDPMYTYKILAVAKSDTGESMVVYEALYTDKTLNINCYDVFVRPYDNFMSEVDHTKYPNVDQKYRFKYLTRSKEYV